MSIREGFETPDRPPDIPVPYGGYHRRVVPPEDAELTHVGPGTPCGEYMRRFWWPVCLSELVTELPLAIRILGEDLVAFRDKSNRVGVLHRHCSHRGTSLEYGIPSERGLRCCYHGWLFDVDGRILETPGEPPDSRLKDSFVHGAYPAFEYEGLIFAYLGPPDEKPAFPMYDTYAEPDTFAKPFSIWHPCNYLQALDNLPDFYHSCFLHNGAGNAALERGEADTATRLHSPYEHYPVMEFRAIDEGNGLICTSVRRVGKMIWIRNNHQVFPAFIQNTGLYEEAKEEKYFLRVALIKWNVPNDDTHVTTLGWRHFNEKTDPDGLGRPDMVGTDKMDFLEGQTGGRPRDVGRRSPGDWEAQTNQRTIARHALEHLGSTDSGVAMMRKLLRENIRGENPIIHPQPLRETGLVPSHSFDTVLPLPTPAGRDDRDYMKEIGHRVTDIVLESASLPEAERKKYVEEHVVALKQIELTKHS